MVLKFTFQSFTKVKEDLLNRWERVYHFRGRRVIDWLKSLRVIFQPIKAIELEFEEHPPSPLPFNHFCYTRWVGKICWFFLKYTQFLRWQFLKFNRYIFSHHQFSLRFLPPLLLPYLHTNFLQFLSPISQVDRLYFITLWEEKRYKMRPDPDKRGILLVNKKRRKKDYLLPKYFYSK